MSGVPARRSMLSGDRVNRIHWIPGTDQLRAVCHCSAERDFEDPVQLWEWLLSHPDGHDTPPPTVRDVAPSSDRRQEVTIP